MRESKFPSRLSIKSGKHLTVSDHTVSAAHPWHWHSFFEIEIILSGSGKCMINNEEYNVGKNNVFLLISTDFHYLKPDKTTRLINVSFDETMIDERYLGELLNSHRNRAYQLDTEEYARVIAAAKLLRHECRIEGECRKNILEYILCCIFRSSSDERIGDTPPASLNYRDIRSAIAYMEIHFKEPITLKRLAAEAGYHPGYFSELYKRTIGEGYVDTLSKLRVGYAQALLANGFSVSDACFESGFGSLSNFLTTFKRLCGVPPSEYRSEARRASKERTASGTKDTESSP